MYVCNALKTGVAAAYFNQIKLDELQTVDEIPGVGDVNVPEGWFKSARIGKVRRDSRTHSSDFHFGEIPPSSITPPLHAYPLGSSSTSRSWHLQQSNQHTVSSSPSHQLSTSSSTQSFPTGQLVPLEYLRNISPLRRDPTDEQLLRRFTPWSSSEE